MGLSRLPPESIRCRESSGMSATALPMRACMARSVAVMSAASRECRRSTGETPSAVDLRSSGFSIDVPCRNAPAFATVETLVLPVKLAEGRTSPARTEGPNETMRALLKTNDPVLLSFAKALLTDADIEAVVFDENASVMDGSLGILPRRLMVADEDFSRARRLLDEALAHKQAPREETE